MATVDSKFSVLNSNSTKFIVGFGFFNWSKYQILRFVIPNELVILPNNECKMRYLFSAKLK